MSSPVRLVGDRYELAEVVGRGGHSVVYRGVDRHGGGQVAIKVLIDRVAGDPEFGVRLVREQRAASALEGTAAVRVHGVASTTEGALCLVMELLTGLDLDDHLAVLERDGRRMSVEAVVECLTPIVETLERAHALGIVHRDLKPGNVFLLDEGAGGGVRLLDFGLAKVPSARPLTRDGVILGSPSYIAPEVWRGNLSAADHRVDAYSLAAIVFRALGGRVPFEAPTPREKLELVTKAPRPSLHALRPDLPPDIDRWVAQALAIDPDSRFYRVRAMWGALLAALGWASETAAPRRTGADGGRRASWDAAARSFAQGRWKG
ncbi:MAG: serine/threonine protein kinase [Polyangiaceae bacterium]|nr:serine/threonine protein kinase [Polyangiaceae bacterium]